MTSPLKVFAVYVCLLLGALSLQASPRGFTAAAAARDAQRDIKNGRMRIYFAGTEAPRERSLESRDVSLVRHLPRDYSLPMGCSEPRADAGITYATVYNRAIIEHLRRARSSR